MKNIFTLCSIVAMLAVSNYGNAQWQQTNGPRGGITSCYASDDDELYTGTYYGGIFRSTDEGASWTACNNGMTSLGIGALCTDNETVYAGAGTNGLYRSTDNGQSWETFPGLWASYSISCIAAQGDNIYVGTAGGGFIASNDGGATWFTAMNGIEPASYYVAQKFLIRGDQVFGLVNYHIYMSTDNAATWTMSEDGLADYGVYSIVDNGPNIIATTAMGLHTSTNEGESWISIASDLPEMPYGMLITTAGNHIYVCDAYYEGLYFSNNNGYDWTQIEFTPENSINGIYALADGKLLAQTSYTSNAEITNEQSALYITTNNGNTWNNVTHEITTSYCISLAVKDGLVYTGTNGQGVFSTPDQGDTWSALGVTNKDLRTMHTVGNTVLVGGDILTRSIDNGETWINASQGLTNLSVQGFANIDDNIFAATADGVFISTDDGQTWSQQNSGISTPYILSIHAVDLILYAGTQDGIFKSTNYGNSWVAINNGLPLNPMVLDINHINGTLVLALYNGGVFTSQDNGENWTNVLSISPVSTLEVSGNILFGGSRADYDVTQTGAFVSFDMGATWQDANQGLTNNMVFDLAIAGDYIYAATLGSGVFKRPLSEFVSNEINQEMSSNISIYPNPASDNITINISSKLIGSDAIITNELGQQVKRIGNVTSTNFQVDCSSLATGFYVVKIGEHKVKLVVQ